MKGKTPEQANGRYFPTLGTKLTSNDSTTSACTTIAGQTGTTYVLDSNDANKYIRVYATGTSTGGTFSLWSASSSQVAADTDGDGIADSNDPHPADFDPSGCFYNRRDRRAHV